MLGYIFKIDKIIVIELSNFTYSVKSHYKSYVNDTIEYKNKHFNQKSVISKMQDEIESNKHYRLLYETTKEKLINLQNRFVITNKDINISYIEVLGYDTLNDFSKVILKTNNFKDKKIRALVTSDGFSAGIVLREDNKIISYLNTSENCNYAVFIGKNNAPGITSGSQNSNIIAIKHIPIWHDVNEGDEVITSGMDNIFPYGIKVGIVQKVVSDSSTKTAYIKPYIDSVSYKNFYILSK